MAYILCNLSCGASISIHSRCKGRIRHSPRGSIFLLWENGGALSRKIKSKLRKSETRKLRRWGKSRHRYWVHALMVGVLLTGEIHLFSAEVLHHHSEVARVCQIEHSGGPYLHASQELVPLCPLCQIIRNSSVRPAVQSIVQKPQRETTFQPIARQARYSSILTPSLLARAPPLS